MLATQAAERMAFPCAFITIQCGECGGIYALNERYYSQRRQEGGDWHCPYCNCRWGFSSGVTENQRLQRQIDLLNNRVNSARSDAEFHLQKRRETERKLAATKGVVTRTKNRIAKGVCPCCKRHFVNLERHMHGQHPDYADNKQS